MTTKYTHMARHARIADELREWIRSGRLEAGDRLPAESELMERYEASRPTVREALAKLDNEGLIIRIHGRGNFVRQTAGLITYAVDDSARDERATRSIAAEMNVSSSVVQAEDDLATRLRVPVDTELTQYVFLSHSMSHPHSLARVFVPRDLVHLDPSEVSGSPLGDGVRDQLTRAGIHIAASVTRVTARHPDAQEAWMLRIGTSTAVLSIERISHDSSGRTVEAALLTLPGHSSEAVFTAHTPTHNPEVAR